MHMSSVPVNSSFYTIVNAEGFWSNHSDMNSSRINVRHKTYHLHTHSSEINPLKGHRLQTLQGK
jgi:hypothetical protein